MMSRALVRRAEVSERVAPVREMLAHVAEMRKFLASLLTAGMLQQTMELAQGHFARGIENRLAQLPRAQGIPKELRPVLATAFAGALLALRNWWLARSNPDSPEKMDREFHRLVWAGVGAPAVRRPVVHQR